METKDTDMIIISGLSGSGKSVALRSLEDIGYYCIDNLPAVLVLEFAAKLQQNLDFFTADFLRNAAVSIDSRNRHFLSELEANLSALENQGTRYRILFLQAEEQKLVHRYSETRRKHPLTDTQTSLIEGIRQEWALLRPLYHQAKKVIDTTDTTPHELRGLIRDFAGGGLAAGPLFLIESFGFKNGTPREADFVFDVRCLPNPYWQEDLAPLTGLDRSVQEFFRDKPEVRAMTTGIFNFLSRWLPGFADENRSYITVAIGCTGGQHRSVFISEQLRTLFSKQGRKVQVRHRELFK
ncbi:MAG: RNase adapter RapZ [Gammaproteobacteria bacterium]|nr:RNase adapter RapZ [Gammaproteobacteria bacterium]